MKLFDNLSRTKKREDELDYNVKGPKQRK